MSLSFDRVAGIYDATRGLPPGVDEQIADVIVEAVRATADTEFLEPGIGTGRIALALVRRGYRYTGVDISEGMLTEFRRKLEGIEHGLTLLYGDVTGLPLADASFDVVVVAHVLHLVPDWKRALAEIRRVLRSDGVVVICWSSPPAYRQDFELQWRGIPSRLGHHPVGVYPAFNEQVLRELAEQGAELETVTAAQWTIRRTVREVLGMYEERVWSSSWRIPNEVFGPAIEELRAWCGARYPSDSIELSSESRFEITIASHCASV